MNSENPLEVFVEIAPLFLGELGKCKLLWCFAAEFITNKELFTWPIHKLNSKSRPAVLDRDLKIPTG